jgi:hypothetical protein
MESLLMPNQPSRQPAMTAFVLTIVNLALIVFTIGLVAVNKSNTDIYSSYAYTRIATVLLIIISVTVLIALVLSVAALFKTIKKPELHVGKGMAIASTLVNGFLSIFAVLIILALVLSLAGAMRL